MATGAAFMRRVVAAFRYRIHIVLTGNGVAVSRCAASKWDRMVHPFDRVCDEHGIKHKLTKPYHPWTNGQAERMNRTVKEATVKTFHYETLESLKAHLQAFLADLQLRQAPQGATMADTFPGRLRRLEERSLLVQDQPAPPHPGT